MKMKRGCQAEEKGDDCVEEKHPLSISLMCDKVIFVYLCITLFPCLQNIATMHLNGLIYENIPTFFV